MAANSNISVTSGYEMDDSFDDGTYSSVKTWLDVSEEVGFGSLYSI